MAGDIAHQGILANVMLIIKQSNPLGIAKDIIHTGKYLGDNLSLDESRDFLVKVIFTSPCPNFCYFMVQC